MKLSLMPAVSDNGIIGSGLNIPWQAKGEQLLFKAMTYNQWLIVGRKTFESMGKLVNRKYAVISRSKLISDDKDVLYFTSLEDALSTLETLTDHAFVCGGGEIYSALLPRADILHLSIIHTQITGDIVFPSIPQNYSKVFEQGFHSNTDYSYQIWQKVR